MLRDYNIKKGETQLTNKYDSLRLRCNLSLVEAMITKDANSRPDIEYVMRHPIFWTHKKMIDFIDDVSNFVHQPSSENEALCNTCVDKLEENYFPKISNDSPDGWFSLLDEKLKPFFTEHYKHHKDKAIKLIRILRNCKHHYYEKKFEQAVKEHIGEMPNDFMIYWLNVFPTLINEMRDAFADLQDKVNFKGYF